MLNKPKVFVLLGTYNGEKYVLEQVDSILQQSYPYFVLLIRDDGSCDLTKEFIRTVAAKDKRVVIIENENVTLGASVNFGVIAEHSFRMGAQYVCFADQDDIWEPWKIERQLDLMLKTEFSLNASTPILLHSDLTVVDDSLGIIHRSYMRFQRIHHEMINPIHVLLVQNFVTGCTMMANRSLLKLSLPIPQKAVMHDWWIALCASTWGEIGFLSEPTVYYRQHSKNEIGAKGFWNLFNPCKASFNKKNFNSSMNYRKSIDQAMALLNSISKQKMAAQADAANVVFQYASIWQKKMFPIKRAFKIQSMGIRRQNILTQLILLVRVAFMRD